MCTHPSRTDQFSSLCTDTTWDCFGVFWDVSLTKRRSSHGILSFAVMSRPYRTEQNRHRSPVLQVSVLLTSTRGIKRRRRRCFCFSRRPPRSNIIAQPVELYSQSTQTQFWVPECRKSSVFFPAFWKWSRNALDSNRPHTHPPCRPFCLLPAAGVLQTDPLWFLLCHDDCRLNPIGGVPRYSTLQTSNWFLVELRKLKWYNKRGYIKIWHS